MLAVDTNIVVRYLMGDDPMQSEQASLLLTNAEAFVSLTVLLETERVLRGLYRIRPQALCQALRNFISLPGIHVEAPLRAGQALDWMAAGMDFADAMHLACAEGCDEFVTFDRDFAQRGEALSGIKLRLL